MLAAHILREILEARFHGVAAPEKNLLDFSSYFILSRSPVDLHSFGLS